MPHSVKFLEQVARYYLKDGSDLRDKVLVFPNKRAMLFMDSYIRKHSRGAIFMPKMLTAGAFFCEISGEHEASRLEQLFTLYDAFCEVSESLNQNASPFDHFRFWGELMLDDFDDVDAQSVDAKSVFTNLKRIQEIRTDFLDEEQRKVAMEIWGFDAGEIFEGFKHSAKEKDKRDLVFNEFLHLSEILYPIYERFHELLSAQGLSSRGMIARKAAAQIEKYLDVHTRQNYGFIGFGIISKTERIIFDRLKKSGRGQFFWNIPDMLTRDLPEEMRNYRSPLKKYVEMLVKKYPIPADFEVPLVEAFPEIKIMGVPSNVMQTKIAANILNHFAEQEAKDKEKGAADTLFDPVKVDNTAVILPSASLLIPLLHSINITPVNVTMGLPLRQTPFATLLSLIIRLNMSGREDFEGEYVYLTQNVVQILSHPSLAILLPEETSALREYLSEQGRYVTRLSDIILKAPGLEFIFRPIDKGGDASQASKFYNDLLDNMLGLVERLNEEKKKKKSGVKAAHEYQVLSSFREAVNALLDVIGRHPRFESLEQINAISFIRLVEKQLMREQMNFSGSPLTGVQIMGALEARSLDFDNVIMLSLNEKTFPPKNFIKSMLPNALRMTFGMTTPEERELEYAWIYAALMSRCRRAFLLYDSSAEGLARGGMSRYVFQTKYIYNAPKPYEVSIEPGGKVETPETIVVDKTPEVLEILNRYKEGGDLNLSASSIITFGECPLKFYLLKVCNIDEKPSTSEAISPIALGNVVHHAMGKIYNIVREKYGSIMDQSFVITDAEIKKFVTEALNEEWYSGQIDTYEKMPHQAQIQIDLWTRKISEIICLEKKRGPYKYVESELGPPEKFFIWEINPDLRIRFRYFIDRVDRVDDKTLRFIDYKTGHDSRTVSSMDNLFWVPKSPDEPPTPNKAVFQVLTYTHAYEEMCRVKGVPNEDDIVPEIILVTQPAISVGKPVGVNRTQIKTHRAQAVSEFLPRFKELVAKIFDPTVPFSQSPFDTNCRYCQFKDICRRNPPEKNWG